MDGRFRPRRGGAGYLSIATPKSAANAVNHYGGAHRWGEMMAARRVLDEVASRFPDHAQIQLELANGAANAIIYYGSAHHWDEMAAARDVL